VQVVRRIVQLDPDALKETVSSGDNLPLHLVRDNLDAKLVVRFLANKRPAALREDTRDGWLRLHGVSTNSL
jgi:hypothetical protein